MLEKIDETATFLKSKLKDPPVFGLITGTGLGSVTDRMGVDSRIPYKNIPNFSTSTTPGHSGHLAIGRLAGKSVMAMEGRVHLYEGYSPKEITFPIRVLAKLGIQYLLVSSAAGGLNPKFESGDLMIVTDHINLTGTNPLVGPNLDAFGPRFPDMSAVYDRRLVVYMTETATASNIYIRQGVYAGILGPSLETPAETRFLRMIGADAVGMSTVCEAIAAAHCGMKIMAIMAITNVNLPDCMEQTTLESVIVNAKEAGRTLSRLWENIIAGIKD